MRQRDRARQKEFDILRSLAMLGEQSSLLSHEVRAPITALRQALRAVADKIGIDDQVLVEELIAQIEQIERLVGQALSFARPLDLEFLSVDLCDVVRAAIKAIAGADDRCWHDHRPRVCRQRATDPGRQAAARRGGGHLLRNAAEACDGKGHVDVTVGASGDEVVIEVTDDGPGVEADKRDEIFLPFRTFKDGGTGIGLAFCRKIVEAHGGSLDLVDRLGLGASFRVAFSLRASHEVAP